MTLLSVTLVLIFIMDPLGNVSSFMAMLKDQPPRRQSQIIMREMLFALALMLIFNFLGEYLQAVLDLSDVAVHLSTGIVLFLTALGVLFPGPRSVRTTLPTDREPFLVPLAIPLVSGPALCATIMLYAQQVESTWIMLVAIAISWAVAVAILLMGRVWLRVLGRNGLIAAERLIAMVLVMLAIQRFAEGVRLFVSQSSGI